MIKILAYVVVILLGAAMFVYGGYDDSPGGQLLGLIAVVSGAARIYLHVRKRKL